MEEKKEKAKKTPKKRTLLSKPNKKGQHVMPFLNFLRIAVTLIGEYR